MGAQMSGLVRQVRAQPKADQLDHALEILRAFLDPLPEFYDRLADRGLHMSASDARILNLLDRRRGAFVDPEALLAAAMGARPVETWPDVGTIPTRISALRGILRRARLPVQIVSWRGVGYRLEAPCGFSFQDRAR